MMKVEMENCSDDTDDEPAVNVTSVSSLQVKSQQENQTFENSNLRSASSGSLKSSLKPA
jgi:hypothetical protein